jgi:hypothetical protein
MPLWRRKQRIARGKHQAREAVEHAHESGLKLSQAARDLLRHALGLVSSPRDAAWREAYNEAAGEARKRINQALREIADDLASE